MKGISIVVSLIPKRRQIYFSSQYRLYKLIFALWKFCKFLKVFFCEKNILVLEEINRAVILIWFGMVRKLIG